MGGGMPQTINLPTFTSSKAQRSMFGFANLRSPLANALKTRSVTRTVWFNRRNDNLPLWTTRPVTARKVFSTGPIPDAKSPPQSPSFPVTSILFQDQTNLFIWAAGFAADSIKLESEQRAGKALFEDSEWSAVRRRAAESFKVYNDERKQVGSRVHDAINKMMNVKAGERFDLETLRKGTALDDEVIECSKALQKWFDTSSLQVLEAEFDVRSVSNRFHGRVDLIAKDTKTNEICVLDFKIKPKELNFDVAMQLAAYALAYNEMKGLTAASPDYCRAGIAVQVKYERGRPAVVVEKRLRDMQAAEVGFHCRNVSFRLERNPANRSSFSDTWLFE